eukprot:15430409-Alexandrium_andersonii.AAC.2
MKRKIQDHQLRACRQRGLQDHWRRMKAEQVWKKEGVSQEEWNAVLKRMGTKMEKDDVKAGKQDFYYQMTCNMCVAKALNITEEEARREIKKHDHWTQKMQARCHAHKQVSVGARPRRLRLPHA